MFCLDQISKNKPTNPSPCLHADAPLPSKTCPPEKPREPEPTIIPATTFTPPEYPASKKMLLIRVEVEAGKVVSESCHYTED